MRFRSLTFITTIAAALLIGPASRADVNTDAPSAEIAQHAVWTPKHAHFVFHGFTSRYSCEGLRERVRRALLDLGARKDLRVQEGACVNLVGGPESFPNVEVTMNVLEPAPINRADPITGSVAAHWRRVNLRLDKDPLWQAEDCELLEQIKRTLLPLFANRNVDYHASCVPYDATLGGAWLSADLLVPDQRHGSE